MGGRVLVEEGPERRRKRLRHPAKMLRGGVCGVGVSFDGEGVLFGEEEVGIDHHSDELLEGGFGFPAEGIEGLGGVAEKVVNFGGAEVEGVDFDVFFPIKVGVAEGLSLIHI